MRKNKLPRKFTKMASIILTILLVLVFLYPGPSQANALFAYKQPAVPAAVKPGDDVKITIRIPGSGNVVRQKTDTMLVMDVTGSMGGSWGGGTKWDAAQAALQAYVASTEWGAQEWDQVGLVVYADCITGGFICSGGAGPPEQAEDFKDEIIDILEKEFFNDVLGEDDIESLVPAEVVAALIANEAEIKTLLGFALSGLTDTTALIDDIFQGMINDFPDYLGLSGGLEADLLAFIEAGGIGVAFSHSRCESCPSNKDFALDGVLAMDAAGRSSLDGFVDDMPTPGGTTPIGAGLELANRQLISFARPNVQKYILLASDGIQNRWPSPYDEIDAFGNPGGPADPTPLEKAIANNIRVVTVGVGSDAAEGLLKDVACRTDPDCNPVPDVANFCDPTHTDPNSVNDLDCPRGYFPAENDSDLTLLYELIQGLIRSDFEAVMFDELNSSIFETAAGAVDIKDWEIWEVDPVALDCTSGTNITGDFTEGGSDPDKPMNIILNYDFGGSTGFWVNFGEIPTNEDRCAILTVTVRGDAPTGSPQDIDAGGSCGGVNGFIGYIPPGGGFEQADCINQRTLLIEANFPAWIQTKDGTVGAIDKIDMERDNLPPGEYNASYVVISTHLDAIKNFTSAKNWLVGQYPDPDPRSWEGSADIYADLLENYRSRGIGTVDSAVPVDRLNDGQVASALAIADSNIVLFTPPSGTAFVNVPDGFPFGGQSGVVFIDGNLDINGEVSIPPGTALVFIVNGAITVDPGVTEINGIFVSNNTNSAGDPGVFSSGSGSNQLTVNGSVLAFGGVDFGRALPGNDNKDTPAELIRFQPSYLWLLRDIAGLSTKQFKELAP